MEKYNGGKKNGKLWGPLYTPPGDSLGGERVHAVVPKSVHVPDPMGYVKTRKEK